MKTLISILFSFFLFAQSFSQTYLKEYSNRIFREFIEVDNNEYSIGGDIFNFDTQEYSNTAIFISDTTGNIVYEWIDTTHTIFPASLRFAKSADGDYIVAGVERNRTYLQKVDIYTNQVKFLVTDSSFKTNILTEVEVLKNGNIVIGGYGKDVNNIRHYYLRCHDSSGGVVWELPSVSTGFQYSEVEGIVATDSLIFVALNVDTSSTSLFHSLNLLKLQYDGQVLMDSVYDFSSKLFLAKQMQVQGDSSVRVFGSANRFGGIFGSRYEARIINFDFDGQVDWDYYYDGGGNTTRNKFSGGMSTPDSTGKIVVFVNDSNPPRISSLLKYVDEVGIWNYGVRLNYSNISQESSADVILLPNGYSLICGLRSVPLYNIPNRAFLSRVNTQGKLDKAVVQGIVYQDLDSDRQFDQGEPVIPNIIIQESTDSLYASSNFRGSYTFNITNAGSKTFTLTNLPAFWEYSSPPNGDTTINIQNLTVNRALNFGIKPMPGISDLAVSSNSTRMRPGFSSYVDLKVSNRGSVPISNPVIRYHANDLATLTEIEDSSFVSMLDTLQWTLATLAVGDEWTTRLWYEVAPDVNLLGQSFCYELSASSSSPDTLLSNNKDSSCIIITGSFDPNDKLASPRGKGVRGSIPPETPFLDYTIRFQNTGTDTAFNIVIIDTLDGNVFNIASIREQNSSHEYTFELNDKGIARWTFVNIALPDSNIHEAGSHGYIKFRIDILPSLPELTEIRNSASIYFDFNPAVVTEDAINTLFTCVSSFANTEWRICEGDSILIGSLYRFAPGVYADTVETELGCDSVLTIQLNTIEVNDTVSVQESALIAASGYDFYQWYSCDDMNPIEGANDATFQPIESGSYQVEISVDSCSKFSECQSVTVVGLENEWLKNHVKVYPNPASEQVMIESEEKLAMLDIQVFNLLGVKLYDRSWTEFRSAQINLETFEAGIYLIHLNSPLGSAYFRIVKE